jgi:hypothetical protein
MLGHEPAPPITSFDGLDLSLVWEYNQSICVFLFPGTQLCAKSNKHTQTHTAHARALYLKSSGLRLSKERAEESGRRGYGCRCTSAPVLGSGCGAAAR